MMVAMTWRTCVIRDKSGSSEIIICSKCKQEKELLYDEHEIVVAETKCKCEYAKHKILDGALKKLFKQREIKNV
jgi:hypothetical protein